MPSSEVRLIINYEELIEKLRRNGKFYQPSNMSDLYFQAADAIEELLNETKKEKKRVPKLLGRDT